MGYYIKSRRILLVRHSHPRNCIEKKMAHIIPKKEYGMMHDYSKIPL